VSETLLSLNPDLARLQEAGYRIEILRGHLLLHDVAYVTEKKEVRTDGILAAVLRPAGQKYEQQDHTVWFGGECPCDRHGVALTKIIQNSNGRLVIDDRLTVQHYLSSKPIPSGHYADHYDKMTTYLALIESHAQAINLNVGAGKGRPVPLTADQSIFKYMDSASSRARINHIADKLRDERVAIIGMGGTGSYVLDLVAKTLAPEIHLYDGDAFLTHNAFRAPGAASLESLDQVPYKVDYFGSIYDNMRRGIVRHPVFLTADNIHELRDKSFVFICVDKGPVRKLIFEALESWSIPFVDVGMGIGEVDSALDGILRTTLSTPAIRSHIATNCLVSFADKSDDDEIYDQNIQIAELNSMNAAFAVLLWKKYRGFYLEPSLSHHVTFGLKGNFLLSEYAP